MDAVCGLALSVRAPVVGMAHGFNGQRGPRLPDVELCRYPVRHVDVSVGEAFEGIAAEDAAFLGRRLLG